MKYDGVHLSGGTEAFERFLSLLKPKLTIRRYARAQEAVNAGPCRACCFCPMISQAGRSCPYGCEG